LVYVKIHLYKISELNNKFKSKNYVWSKKLQILTSCKNWIWRQPILHVHNRFWLLWIQTYTKIIFKLKSILHYNIQNMCKFTQFYIYRIKSVSIKNWITHASNSTMRIYPLNFPKKIHLSNGKKLQQVPRSGKKWYIATIGPFYFHMVLTTGDFSIVTVHTWFRRVLSYHSIDNIFSSLLLYI
jgi:hypothetical protein